MKMVFLVLATASLVIILFSPSSYRPFLLLLLAASVLAASLTITPAVYFRAGWPSTKYTLLTLGTQSAACFLSTVFNVVAQPSTTIALLLLIINTYLFIRLAAESTALASTDHGVATASILLGLLSYLFYIVSVFELVHP